MSCFGRRRDRARCLEKQWHSTLLSEYQAEAVAKASRFPQAEKNLTSPDAPARCWLVLRKVTTVCVRVSNDLSVVSRVPVLTYDISWRNGDIALVDNYVAMHGRRAFKGTRKVLASLVA